MAIIEKTPPGRALAGAGALIPAQLAARTGPAERYVREWLPASLSQHVRLAVGAQAGEARLREVVTEPGFTRLRRAAENPFNLVREARP